MSKSNLGYEYTYDTADGADEYLQTGYHNCKVKVTSNSNNQTRILNEKFYIFNASPILSSPVTGTVLNSTRPTLRFSSVGVDNADHYEVIVYDPVTDKDVFYTVLIETGQEDYSVTIPESRALKPGTKYIWQVIAEESHYEEMGEAVSEALLRRYPNG